VKGNGRVYFQTIARERREDSDLGHAWCSIRPSQTFHRHGEIAIETCLKDAQRLVENLHGLGRGDSQRVPFNAAQHLPAFLGEVRKARRSNGMVGADMAVRWRGVCARRARYSRKPDGRLLHWGSETSVRRERARTGSLALRLPTNNLGSRKRYPGAVASGFRRTPATVHPGRRDWPARGAQLCPARDETNNTQKNPNPQLSTPPLCPRHSCHKCFHPRDDCQPYV